MAMLTTAMTPAKMPAANRPMAASAIKAAMATSLSLVRHLGDLVPADLAAHVTDLGVRRFVAGDRVLWGLLGCPVVALSRGCAVPVRCRGAGAVLPVLPQARDLNVEGCCR
jgi:hypothetical protein